MLLDQWRSGWNRCSPRKDCLVLGAHEPAPTSCRVPSVEGTMMLCPPQAEASRTAARLLPVRWLGQAGSAVC